MYLGVPLLDLQKVPAHVYITRAQCDPRTVCVPDLCPLQMRRAVPWQVEDFILHKQLYKGKASLLYSATCRFSKIPIALKLYRKAKLSNLNWYQVEREIRIHSQLCHKNIIRLYAAFEDSDNVYLAQEFASGGDLYEDLKKNGGSINEERVSTQIIQPCMEALAYLHEQGIIHRDIKSENILLAGDGTVKLADFGLSINFRDERPVTRAGTLDMMAPEVLVCPEKSRPEENKEQVVLEYTAAVDAWAIGIVCFELMVGHPPFEKKSQSQTYEHIMYRAPEMPACLSSGAKQFITSALVKAVSKRPSVVDLLRHPWLEEQMQSRAARFQNMQIKKAEASSSVNITVDCTVGDANKGPSSGSSSSNSADSAETTEARAETASTQAAEASKSVLQWAGSSLKTMSKKLRKPPLAESGPSSASAPAQPRIASPAASPRRVLIPRPLETLPGVFTPAARQLHIQLPVEESEPVQKSEGSGPDSAPSSPFKPYASMTPSPTESPRIGAGGYGGPTRFGHPPPGSRGSENEAAHRMKSLRLTPRGSHKTSGSILQDLDQRHDSSSYSQQRRDLIATKSGLEVEPASPPAYIARPWLTQRLHVTTAADQSPPSPMAHTPSPLARRRRRIAGKADTSCSGAMSFADTPKGGHFPSGAKTARSFTTASHALTASPSAPKTARSQNLPVHSKGKACGLPSSPKTNRQQLGSNTLPRPSDARQEMLIQRAFSANPVRQPAAPMLQMTARRLNMSRGDSK